MHHEATTNYWCVTYTSTMCPVNCFTTQPCMQCLFPTGKGLVCKSDPLPQKWVQFASLEIQTRFHEKGGLACEPRNSDSHPQKVGLACGTRNSDPHPQLASLEIQTHIHEKWVWLVSLEIQIHSHEKWVWLASLEIQTHIHEKWVQLVRLEIQPRKVGLACETRNSATKSGSGLRA